LGVTRVSGYDPTMDSRDDSPVASLASAIEETALKCAEPLQGWINLPTDEEQKERWLEIVWEHLFLLMHLVNRNASGILDEETHQRLIQELAPLVLVPLAAEISEGRPDDARQRLVREAFERLNRSEREYAECERFLSEPGVSGNSLVSVFARKVNGLAGGSMKPDLMAEFVKRTVEAYKSLGLKDRIAAVDRYLRSGESAPS
jgi:hypothetical protein